MQGENYSLKLISHEISHIKFDIINNNIPIGDIPFYFTSTMTKQSNDEIVIDLIAEIKSNDFPIALSLDLKGSFYIKNWELLNMNEEIELKLVQILFPYLRSAITNITALAGTSIITLPIINVANLLEK